MQLRAWPPAPPASLPFASSRTPPISPGLSAPFTPCPPANHSVAFARSIIQCQARRVVNSHAGAEASQLKLTCNLNRTRLVLYSLLQLNCIGESFASRPHRSLSRPSRALSPAFLPRPGKPLHRYLRSLSRRTRQPRNRVFLHLRHPARRQQLPCLLDRI